MVSNTTKPVMVQLYWLFRILIFLFGRCNKYKINKFIKNHNIQNIITNNRNEDNNLSRLAYPMALIPVETSVRSNRTTNLIPMIIEEITPTENKNENYINIIPSNESNDAPPEYNV